MSTMLRAVAALSALAILGGAGGANAEGNFFAGAGLGISMNGDYDCSDCGAPIGTLEDDGFGFKVFGGYRFNPYFAVQGGYVDLADTTATGEGDAWSDKLEVSGLYAAVQGIYPVSPAFELFATGGIMFWNQDVTFDGETGSFDGTSPLLGAGASYRIPGSPTAVQLEWTHYFEVGTEDEFFGHVDDYDLVTLNIVVEF